MLQRRTKIRPKPIIRSDQPAADTTETETNPVIADAEPVDESNATVKPISTESLVKPAVTQPVSTELLVKPALTQPISTESLVKPAVTQPISTESLFKPAVTQPVSTESLFKPVVTHPVYTESLVQPAVVQSFTESVVQLPVIESSTGVAVKEFGNHNQTFGSLFDGFETESTALPEDISGLSLLINEVLDKGPNLSDLSIGLLTTDTSLLTELNEKNENHPNTNEKESIFQISPSVSEKEKQLPIAEKAVKITTKVAASTSKKTKEKTESPDERRQLAEKLANRLVARRVAERQKGRATETLKEPVNSQMSIKDLIYKNPVDNPMSKTECKTPTAASKEKESLPVNSPPVRRRNMEKQETAVDEDSFPVPQLKFDENGKIVINEESYVIHQKELKFEDMEVVDETNYQFEGYPRRPRSKRWGVKETMRFYAVLSMIGTDFSLMTPFFPARTRDDIKKKFKKEDKVNRFLIDTALKERKPLDISLLAEPLSENESLIEEPIVKKKTKTSAKEKENMEASGSKSKRKPRRPAKRKASESCIESSGEVNSSAPEKATKKTRRCSKKIQIKKRKREKSPESDGKDSVETIGVFDYQNESEEDSDVEVIQVFHKRSGRDRRVRRIIETPSPPTVADEPSSLSHNKLAQQVEQMEADQAINALKVNFDDSADENTQSTIDDVSSQFESESVTRDSKCESIELIVDKPAGDTPAQPRASINVIDHETVELESLGIGKIPEGHKLVVISVPLPPGSAAENKSHPTSDESQLLHVFVVPQDTLNSMMEVVNNSELDPASILLAMANGSVTYDVSEESQAVETNDQISVAKGKSLTNNENPSCTASKSDSNIDPPTDTASSVSELQGSDVDRKQGS